MIDVVARVLAVIFLPFARSTHARNETSVVALPRTFSEIQRAEPVMTSGADHPDPAILADRRREHEDLKRRGVTQDALDGPAPLEMWAALRRVSQELEQLSFPPRARPVEGRVVDPFPQCSSKSRCVGAAPRCAQGHGSGSGGGR